MLAQNFKTATDLGISDAQLGALVKVLGMLERQELRHTVDGPMTVKLKNGFNMEWWGDECPNSCGTVRCIGGWAEYIGNVEFKIIPDSLMKLFYPSRDGFCQGYEATPTQAAIAVRNYLTYGEPHWALAMAEQLDAF